MAGWADRGLMAALVAGSMLLATLPVLSEPVRVRAAAHDGYGRIVFNWPEPVIFDTETKDGRLIVNFGRPIESSYTAVLRDLKAYITDATPGQDGRSVVFTLRGPHTIRSFDMGAAVVIDVVKEPQATSPKPATETVLADSGPLVQVRTGRHKGFTRVVFDWPQKVGYKLSRQDGKAVLTFNRAARFNLKPLQGRPPKFIGGASQASNPDGTTVVLQVADTSRIRESRFGPKVVIDVMAPSPVQVSKQTGQSETAEKTASAGQPVPPASKKPPVQEEALPVANAEPVKTAKPVEATKPAETAEQTTQPVPLTPGKPRPLTPSGLTKEAAAIPGKSAVRDSSGVLSGQDEASLAAMAGVKIVDPKAGASGPGVGGQGDGDAVGIRIDWDEPVAAAVFRRVGSLWVVFDKPVQMDLQGLRAAAGNIIRDVEQIPNERATLLRMTTLSGINPSLKRDGLAWILEFRQQPLQPVTAIEITPQPRSPIGARLFLSVTEPGEGIVLTDPTVGDNLVIVPVIPLGYGVAVAREYPQTRILASSQGIVIKPKTDDLRVRPLRQGVEVTSGAGLQLSDIPAELAAESKLDDGTSMRTFSRLFDLAKWRQVNVETFNETRQELQRVAAGASMIDREKARMDLVRFFFANGYGAEALGVLREVARDNPEIKETAEYRGISGAINTLMQRFEEAHADLDHSALDDNDEGVFWRAVLLASEGDLIGAGPDLRRMGGVMRPYPKPLKIPMGILMAKAMVELGDIKQSNRYLDTMRAMEPNSAQSSELDYIEGQLKELSGDFDGAIGKWESVQEGAHRPSRAKAAIARTELLLKLEQIDTFQAIQNLEELRFSWRGDPLEFELLRRLGGLYLEIGDYRNGLRTLRQAATHFRDYADAPEVTQQMTDAFTSLYLEDAADSLPPITAIALYDEFKELTPPGEAGDEMIRKLADRLADVDLLDRAAGLLQAQIDFRLKGLEKARVGTRLALLHIFALEYGQAVESLEQTEMPDMPEDLTLQRRHLMARALMGLQQSDDALALLNDDKSHDAELLRTEIFWSDGDWVEAAKSLRRLLKSTGAKPNKPVNQQQAEYLLNLAVAMTLSGNEQGIARMRNEYATAMEDTTFRDAFRLIASTQNLGLIQYGSIARKVTDVENFQSFMAAYQERLKERKLSAIN